MNTAGSLSSLHSYTSSLGHNTPVKPLREIRMIIK